MANPKIITVHVRPPIPCRVFDWCAFRDGEEESGRYGWGMDEGSAIADLLDLEMEDEHAHK